MMSATVSVEVLLQVVVHLILITHITGTVQLGADDLMKCADVNTGSLKIDYSLDLR